MLLCLSASHKTAAFDLLERLSRTPDDLASTLVDSAPGVRGAVVLATCNRFEAYLELEPPHNSARDDTAAITRVIHERTGIDHTELTQSAAVYRGHDVAEHLFAVASGLESVVSGEGEIAGQVRRALTDARDAGTTSPQLERLFQRASHAQRKVKNLTALSRAGRSLVRLSLELAASRIADWATERVLLVGTGEYAAVTLAALRERGATDIAVHSPSGRAEEFATKHALRAFPATEFAAEAARSTLLITCTNATDHVVDAKLFRSGQSPAIATGCPVPTTSVAPSRLIIDLGMPRNVNPNVASIEGVTLLDLETIRLHAPLEELHATEAARTLIRDAAADFRSASARRAVTPAIVALRSHVFSLLDAEIARVRGRGDHDGRIEQSLRHLAGVLLHSPTTRAHELADGGRADEYINALHTLFGIDARNHDANVTVEDKASGF